MNQLFEIHLTKAIADGKTIIVKLYGRTMKAKVIEVGLDCARISIEADEFDEGQRRLAGTYIIPFSNLAIKEDAE